MTARHRRGAALVAVLLALAILLALGVPFLLASRLRSEAAREGFDRARARVALASATRFSMEHLAATHPAVDPTPLWDDPAEWRPELLGPLPAALGEEWGRSESWGLETEEAQARVSLATAPPLLLQNLVHPCFLAEEVDVLAETELQVTSTAGFPEQGLLWVQEYLLSYDGLEPQRFLDVQLLETPEDREELVFQPGTLVLDPRILGVAVARLQRGWHAAPEFLDELLAADPTGSGPLPEADRRRLTRLCTLKGGGMGPGAWEPATWLQRPIQVDNSRVAVVVDGSAVASGSTVRFLPAEGGPLDQVVLVARGRNLRFPLDLPPDLEPFSTRVYPLRRDPVDLNAASAAVLEALVTGLRWRPRLAFPVPEDVPVRGSPRNDWISPAQAREFAARVVAARPLRGADDLWARVLAPMADDGVLTDFEAWAIYLNGIDPNNGLLAQSTVPFTYRGGDVWLQRVTAAVRSPLGRTLARSAVRQRLRTAPDGPLLRLWQDQRAFADLVMPGRGAHGTTTLPANLGVSGGHHDPATDLLLQVGVFPWVGRQYPVDREEESAVTPLPARESDLPMQERRGRVEHFDFWDSPLGYDVRAHGPIREPVTAWGLGRGSGLSAVEPVDFQGWFEMPDSLPDAWLFDLAGPETDRMRVYAALEGGRLVVRAFDNAGDDPGDEDGLVQAVEVVVDPADEPLDGRWLHLEVLLRAVSPRGVQVAVDGVPRGRVSGLTWTTARVAGYAPGSPDEAIPVESTEGFPNRGALLIGDEVVEYSAKTPNSFITERTPGPRDWIGGRAAREPSDSLAASLDTDHPAGAAVRLYGYSAVLASDIPPGGGRMSGGIGPFSVATAIDGRDQVQITTIRGRTVNLGQGIGCSYVGDVELAPMVEGDPWYADAFQEDGGYAILFQIAPTDSDGMPLMDANGCRLGGVELVQYSQRQGTRITLVQRAVASPGLAKAPSWIYQPTPAAFVTEWDPGITNGQGQALADLPEWRVFLLPCSIKGTGVSGLAYLPAGGEFSEFVQITPAEDDGLTEWVRYDRILNGAFLRDDWTAVQDAVGAWLRQERVGYPNPDPLPGPGGSGPSAPPPEPPPPAPPARPQEGQQGDYNFIRRLGSPESGRPDEIEIIRLGFGFRGVLGTWDHAHQVGERLVPVFRTVRRVGAWSGYPGRLDRVAVMQPDSTSPPAWYTVQWAGVPPPEPRLVQGVTYVAFREDPGLPFLAAAELPDLNDAGTDVRLLPRLVKFPSGERPLGLDRLAVGGDVPGVGAPFPGRVDEVVLAAPAGMGPPTAARARGAFLLREDVQEMESRTLRLNAYALLVDGRRRDVGNAGGWLENLPGSGILDVDGERIGYTEVDPATGEITVAPEGRGLHGTERRGHAAGTLVWLVDGRPSGALTTAILAGDAALPVDGARRFPARGLVLVDRELLHTFFLAPGGEALLMPRRRPDPGSPDRTGDGLLRGRFGTTAASHPQGAIAYSFPCRFEDRWVLRSDSPAGAWFALGLEDPDAVWRGLFFDAEVPDASQSVQILARIAGPGAPSWEDDPDRTPGLVLVDRPRGPDGGPVPLGLRGDRLELRIGFSWGPGSFDPVTFQATGWTTAPRLRRLGVDSLAQSRVDRWEEVVE